MWVNAVVSAFALLSAAAAAPQVDTTTATTASSYATTESSTSTVSTATAEASQPSAYVPAQEPDPPVQAWCPSQIFCPGSLLQTVNLADVYSDPKTIVDKPTSKRSQQVLADFAALGNVSTITEEDIVDFEDDDFTGEGLELMAVTLTDFTDDPAFLQNVSDPLVRAFSQTVHGYWQDLVRATNTSATCPYGTETGNCEGSFIPLNHTFVIPGGRFREQYYWDTYWIIQGLIKSELYDIANDTLQNFMDEIETFGFIPNGGRIYYLDRSQPPLFVRMIYDYVTETNDTDVLTRALPMAEIELQWWINNRSLPVTSPYTNKTYTMFHYSVNSSAPRPESYIDDYEVAFDSTLPELNETERSALYGELATGAETGWDFSSRFSSDPLAGGSNNTNPAMRAYNAKNHIAVDLNSILYKAHTLLAELYNSTGNTSAAASHVVTAATLREGILDLCWEPSKLAFYDFNLTANARNAWFTAATFYPLWNGIVPDELLESEENAFGFFASVNMVMNRYNGSIPVTFHETGLQWDAPNAWPPHTYIVLEALSALPSNVTASTLPTPASNESTYSLIPAGQINVTEADLPGQPITVALGNATKTGPGADISRLNGTVVNGGNATDGEGWGATLQREVANRYVASALCSWHATGGSIDGLLPRLSDEELNVTGSINNTGNMFEKFNISDVDSSGSGGEYTVQAGFGWTNGILLWIAGNYGDLLVAPYCPNILEIVSASNTTNTTTTTTTTTNTFSTSTSASASASVLVSVSVSSSSSSTTSTTGTSTSTSAAARRVSAMSAHAIMVALAVGVIGGLLA